MPILTPTGELAQPLEDIRQALARSANFRTWVGAADATAALGYVWPNGVPAPAQDRWVYTRLGQSSGQAVAFSPPTYSYSPVVSVVFCGKAPTTPDDYTDAGNAWTWLMSSMGPVTTDVLRDTEAPAVRSFTIREEPQGLAIAPGNFRILGELRLNLEPRDFAG